MFKAAGWLSPFFPGPYSHKGACATAKIQLRLNLLEENYEGLCLQSFRDNDQKHAGTILSSLQPHELVIRDLGYWSLPVFRGIAQRQAYFLSRYKYGVSCLEIDTKQPIDLLKYLKAQHRKGLLVIDRPILRGKDEQLPVRLVAIKVPQQIAQYRRRKAATDRNQRAKHSSEYMQLLDWSIFITNVPQQTWSYREVLKAYGFRWHIETVFKCWKSKFKLGKLFEHKQSLSPARVVITCLLFLLFLTLFFVPLANYFIRAVQEKAQKQVSLMKLADFVKERFQDLLLAKDLEEFVPAVAYYCTYEKRNKRRNHLELLYEKILS
ncbi:MAG: transposase [Lewinellaceae bacterium]|nr:transposase [Lewinellaceae bacterium]